MGVACTVVIPKKYSFSSPKEKGGTQKSLVDVCRSKAPGVGGDPTATSTPVDAMQQQVNVRSPKDGGNRYKRTYGRAKKSMAKVTKR